MTTMPLWGDPQMNPWAHWLLSVGSPRAMRSLVSAMRQTVPETPHSGCPLVSAHRYTPPSPYHIQDSTGLRHSSVLLLNMHKPSVSFRCFIVLPGISSTLLRRYCASRQLCEVESIKKTLHLDFQSYGVQAFEART